MLRIIAALTSGVVFGIGLALAGMLNPAKVVGFLDIFGVWDPSLAFVMIGGIAVNLIGLRVVLRREAPLLCDRFILPTATTIDRPLIIGSLIFGVGWGLAGLCPGPVISSLMLNPSDMAAFALVLVAGLMLGRWVAPKLT
ncbi:MAG: YeeE/YedE family protein [Candidatus Puniceispirillum sp.]